MKSLLLVMGSVGMFAGTALADTLEASSYWRFEEAAGGTVADSGQFGLSGVLYGSPSWVSDTAVTTVPLTDLGNGTALELNWQNSGSGGYFLVDDPTDFLRVASGSFTFEAWVKLEHVSTNGGANQRQWLCQKKPDNGPGERLDYALLVQAGDLGSSGNELLFQCGDGTSTLSVMSALEITDLDWHFVSIAYDSSTGSLRFGLDGVYDTQSFTKPYWPPLTEGGADDELYDGGPLRVGGHENASGAANQFVRGRIDEVRFTRIFLPTNMLLDGPMQDCNQNGTADALELSAGTSSDCDQNFIPDDCDSAENPSRDCNGDGVLDLCQIDPYAYSLDDGTGEARVRSDGTHTAWLNRYVVANDVTTITHLELPIAPDQAGNTHFLYVWSDPDGDGNPTDAQVLVEYELFLTEGNIDQFLLIDIPDVEIGPNGTSFFIGAMVETPDTFPAIEDITAPHFGGQSWIIGKNSAIDPNNLSDGAIEFATTESFLTGNWLMRGLNDLNVVIFQDCNYNGVADECDISSGDSQDEDGNEFPDECDYEDTYYVPDDFESVDRALRTIPSGSEIVVRPGTYFGTNYFFGKEIVLRSEAGADVTILDGTGGDGPVVAFLDQTGPGAMLDGFTIRNGTLGGVFLDESSPTIQNNIIEFNTNSARYAGGIEVNGPSSPQIVANTIRDNIGNSGGGILLNGLGPNDQARIFDNTILRNTVDGHGGGIALYGSIANIEDNVIDGNYAGGDSGGGIFVFNFISDQGYPQLLIHRNVIRNNEVTDDGGGIFLVHETGSDPNARITNCLIEGNIADVAGGITVRPGCELTNNTFVNNYAVRYGGGVHFDNGGELAEMTNCIVVGNTAGLEGQNFYGFDASPAVSISYSCVEGGIAGTGNIDADPSFVDPSTGDFRLANDSACIDMGLDAIVEIDAVDLDGNERIVGVAVDMGSYENQDAGNTCPGDLDGSGSVDGADLTLLLGGWGGAGNGDLDGSGTIDGADLTVLLGSWGLCE